MELASYVAEYQAGKITASGLEFWQQKQLVYSVLVPLTLDLISVSASAAYSERGFNWFGDLCAPKRHRLSRNRELLKNEQYCFVSIITQKDRV